MIRRASRRCPRSCSKLCSSCPVSSGRHYWHRSRGGSRGRWVVRRDVRGAVRPDASREHDFTAVPNSCCRYSGPITMLRRFCGSRPTPTRLVWVRIPNTQPILVSVAFDEHAGRLSKGNWKTSAIECAIRNQRFEQTRLKRSKVTVDINCLTDFRALPDDKGLFRHARRPGVSEAVPL